MTVEPNDEQIQLAVAAGLDASTARRYLKVSGPCQVSVQRTYAEVSR